MRQRLTVRSRNRGWSGVGLKEDVSSEYGFSNSNSLSPNAGAGTGNSTKTDTGTKGTRSRSREKRSARESALALLEYRDRTEQELRQKLLDREYSKDEIEETVRFLREYRYLDDEAYAMRFIRSQSGKKIARQIRAALIDVHSAAGDGVKVQNIRIGLRQIPCAGDGEPAVILVQQHLSVLAE